MLASVKKTTIMTPKLTRQGVRDLGSVKRKPKLVVPNFDCAHERAKNDGIHMYCPDCKLYYDAVFDGNENVSRR